MRNVLVLMSRIGGTQAAKESAYYVLRRISKVFSYRSSIKKRQILKNKREKSPSIIKVGFIVQMPEIWDKESSIYEQMLIDNRFDPWLIILPTFERSKMKADDNATSFFLNKYANNKYITITNDNYDVIDDSFDYVFYQRCWENYLPKQLRCKNVINKAMTVYVPYCYHGSPVGTSYYEKDFFWYLSKFYCCSLDQKEEVKSIKYVNCDYLGYPVFDTLNYDNASQVKNGKVKILWTPRWTNDPSLGGTSFVVYKDSILRLARAFDNINLVLRPHPLTFENAIRQKWMTAQEVELYKDRVVAEGAFFDSNAIIEDSFFNTDILITDFTSAIVTYFLSGRPVIFCAKTDFLMTETFRKIIDSSYVVSDYLELETTVKKLINGIDPLYPKRKSVIEEIKPNFSSTASILDDMERYIM